MKTAMRYPAGISLESAREGANHCSRGDRGSQRAGVVRRVEKRLCTASANGADGIQRRSLIYANNRLLECLLVSNKQLNQANQEIRQINQSKSEFMAKISHDFRTPLNVIIGFSELMLDEVPGKINKTQKQSLNDVLTSARHLLEIVKGIPGTKRRTSPCKKNERD